GGGISGVWGPPTVMYLSTKQLEKQAQMRAQGVIYGFGAVFLLLGHWWSGIVNSTTIPLSIMAIVPACFGIWLGFKVQDSINQRVFRIATLLVLICAGINLIRRGVMG
ncbi:MAG: TSUP family transporter, partial [Planktomarina sp.]